MLILAALIYITSALHCTAEIMHTKQTTRPAGLICRLCNGDDQSHHMECLAHSLARPRSILCCLAVLLLAILLSCCLTALLSCCLAAFAVCCLAKRLSSFLFPNCCLNRAWFSLILCFRPVPVLPSTRLPMTAHTQPPAPDRGLKESRQLPDVASAHSN